MAQESEYHTIIVESFYPKDTSGRHGLVHVRPAKHQIFPQSLFVECSRDLVNTTLHPVGTKFRIKVKLTDREGGTNFLYNSYRWPYYVVSDDEFRKLYSKSKYRR